MTAVPSTSDSGGMSLGEFVVLAAIIMTVILAYLAIEAWKHYSDEKIARLLAQARADTAEKRAAAAEAVIRDASQRVERRLGPRGVNGR